MLPGLLKANIDGIDGRVKRHDKALTEDQLNEMQSTKVIMALWVRWKKPVKSAITLHPKDQEDAKDVEGNADGNYTVEPVYRGHLVMVDTFLVAPIKSRPNTYRKTPYTGNTFIASNCYIGHYFLAPCAKVTPNLPIHSGQSFKNFVIVFVGTNFRKIVQNRRNTRKLLPVKIT